MDAMVKSAAHPAKEALDKLWRGARLPPEALDAIVLPASPPVLPSSFDITTAAQASLGAAALAAVCIAWLRVVVTFSPPPWISASVNPRASSSS